MSKISWVDKLYKTLRAETIIPQGSAITLQMYPKGETDQCIKQLKEQIRHQKYKRCLALSAQCEYAKFWHKNTLYGSATVGDYTDVWVRKVKRAEKWQLYWAKLAERFKG